jgi:hypothetical protein
VEDRETRHWQASIRDQPHVYQARSYPLASVDTPPERCGPVPPSLARALIGTEQG